MGPVGSTERGPDGPSTERGPDGPSTAQGVIMLGAYQLLIDKPVIIRTAGYHYIGVLVDVGPDYFVVTDAVWVADTGRWSQALASGQLGEVEPWPDPTDRVIIGRGLVGDVTQWRHPIPRVAS